MKKRVFEIDFLRGVAIILMTIFHLLFDLAEYYDFNIDYSSGVVFYIGRISAVAFIILSGISSNFSKNNFKRAVQFLLAALLVTVVSIPTMGEYYIRFGVLHFFALATLLKALADKFIKNKEKLYKFLPVIIIFIFYLGGVFENIRLETSLLLPIGIRYSNFQTNDYYPLVPWFGLFLIGILIAEFLYKDKKSMFDINEDSIFIKMTKPICFLGRHSLIIYLTHQVVLLGVLFLIFAT